MQKKKKKGVWKTIIAELILSYHSAVIMRE